MIFRIKIFQNNLRSTQILENITARAWSAEKYGNSDECKINECKDWKDSHIIEKKDIELEKKKVLRNREKFNNYKKEIESIDTFGQFNSSTEKINISYLCSLEKEMFEESILLPKQNLYVLVRLYHSNINGRILERKEQEFELSEVESLIKRLNNKTGNFYNDRDIWDSICRVERGKVSNKMRFSIYDRDGYRCRYCGRSGKFWDLEIDHIKPISKGGKSTYDNLQTLCKRCNKEKGNKY